MTPQKGDPKPQLQEPEKFQKSFTHPNLGGEIKTTPKEIPRPVIKTYSKAHPPISD